MDKTHGIRQRRRGAVVGCGCVVSCLEERDPSLHVLVVLQQPRRHQRHVQRVGALCPPASYNTRRHIECSVDLITPNS